MKLQELVTLDTKIINEYLDSVVNDSKLLNESVLTEAAFKDFLAKNAQKLKTSLSKVKNPVQALDDLQGKIWVKLQTSNVSKEDRAKLVQFAKKHAKLVKPAIIVAVIGASLLGMDAAQASEIVNNLDNIPSDQIEHLLDPVSDVLDSVGEHPDASQDNFTSKFLQKMKQLYDNGKNPIKLNGQTMPFEDVVKYAQQKTGVDAKDFVQHIGQQKDMSVEDGTKEFFRWLQQRDAKGHSVYKDI